MSSSEATRVLECAEIQVEAHHCSQWDLAEHVEPQWINPTTIKIQFKWPKWFNLVVSQVAFQKGEDTAFVFDSRRECFESMQQHVKNKVDLKKKEVWDLGFVRHGTAMNTNPKKLKMEIVTVELSPQDLEEGEDMPPGNKINIPQIVAEVARKSPEAERVSIGKCKAKTGKDGSVPAQQQQLESFQWPLRA